MKVEYLAIKNVIMRGCAEIIISRNQWSAFLSEVYVQLCSNTHTKDEAFFVFVLMKWAGLC